MKSSQLLTQEFLVETEKWSGLLGRGMLGREPLK
jgi:hypothetical protein